MGRESHYLWLKDIVAVRPIDPFPQIGVVLTSGEAHHYYVLTSRATAPSRGSSHPTRDAAIQHILAVAKSDAPRPTGNP
jgi:hypothetical protein